MQVRSVYLDYAATTDVHPDVLEAMMPYLQGDFGNPNSIHSRGRVARQAVDESRDKVAHALNCRPSEITFTSCATESINLAIKGIVKAKANRGHIITSAIEHHAVLHSIEQLEREGYEATIVPVSADGLVDPDDVQKAIRPDTLLVSVMYANNQIGTVQPVREIGTIASAAGISFHIDAVQAARSEPLDVDALGVTSLALSGHKFHAPKGVGIMYLREGTPLESQIQGGGQEQGRRSGTENVPYIVGVATALERVVAERDAYISHCTALRNQLIDGLLDRVPDSRLNGHRTQRLPNNANLSFAGTDAQGLIMGLDIKGICASSDSACQQAALKKSHVLEAIGVPDEYMYGSLRLTVGEDTTKEDCDYVLEQLPELVSRLRAFSSVGV